MVKKERDAVLELGKKAIGVGLGLISITEKKARAIIDELIKKGEIKKEEAEEVINNLLKKTEKDRKTLEERLAKIIKNVVEKLPLATRKELDEVKKRLEELEKKV